MTQSKFSAQVPWSSKGSPDRSPSGAAKPRIVRALFVVLVLSVLSSGIYFAHRSGTNAEVYSNDFNVYYQAAKEIQAGRDPYNKSLGDWTPYLYPPLLAE